MKSALLAVCWGIVLLAFLGINWAAGGPMWTLVVVVSVGLFLIYRKLSKFAPEVAGETEQKKAVQPRPPLLTLLSWVVSLWAVGLCLGFYIPEVKAFLDRPWVGAILPICFAWAIFGWIQERITTAISLMITLWTRAFDHGKHLEGIERAASTVAENLGHLEEIERQLTRIEGRLDQIAVNTGSEEREWGE